MADEDLHVLKGHALLQQVGDDEDPERVRAEVRRQAGTAEPALELRPDHAGGDCLAGAGAAAARAGDALEQGLLEACNPGRFDPGERPALQVRAHRNDPVLAALLQDSKGAVDQVAAAQMDDGTDASLRGAEREAFSGQKTLMGCATMAYGQAIRRRPRASVSNRAGGRAPVAARCGRSGRRTIGAPLDGRVWSCQSAPACRAVGWPSSECERPRGLARVTGSAMPRLTTVLGSLGGLAGLALLVYIGMWIASVESRLAEHERHHRPPTRYENADDCPQGSELVSRDSNASASTVWCRDLTP